MTFILPNLPSSKGYSEEKADFWEIEVLKWGGGAVSQRQILKSLSVELNEMDHEGIISEDDRLEEAFEDVWRELSRRAMATDGKYPFGLKEYHIHLQEEETLARDVYLFLLLCTRLNMRDQKVYNGIDATSVFEDLCGIIAERYFGHSAFSYILGTSQEGNFRDKVKELIRQLGEGQGFKNPNTHEPVKNDDSVDLVVWKEFADQEVGKLIGFAQCKTGTNWRDAIKKLKPNEFCKNWLKETPVVSPLPIVFLADTLYKNYNFPSDHQEYLVFNRFRILEYLPPENELTEQEKSVIAQIRSWLEGAMAELNSTH